MKFLVSAVFSLSADYDKKLKHRQRFQTRLAIAFEQSLSYEGMKRES